MPLSAGTKLGPYEILSAIGAGGMGEVYKARDTRLDRIVAIKVLPTHLADRAELRERFDREARTIASLNHPHICVLHDIGHQNGIDFLVMEYLEGETLAQRLVKGPLPMQQVLQYAIEISDALDKAHRKGITHRDLKPGNVMLTKSGTKLLDFGLAKLKQDAAPAIPDSQLPTMKSAITGQGMILGTLQYMAPEQVEGKTDQIDARTDIFAFGAVVYEMATGKKAFEGQSQASLIAKILETDPPPISSLQPLTPPALDRVVKTCLAKDPDDRWQTARDLSRELKWASESGDYRGGAAAAAPAGGSKTRPELPWLILCAFIVIVALGAAWWRTSRPSEPTMYFRGPTSFSARDMAVAPNGHTIAATGYKESARKSVIWIYELGSQDARPLADTEGASFPFWSADGKSLGFFADGKLRKLDLEGGSVQTLCDAPSGRGGTWNQGGIILFTPSGQLGTGLYRIAASGGTPTPVSSPDASRGETSQRWPMFLPDGRHFLYMSFDVAIQGDSNAIFVGSLDSKEKRFVTKATANAAYAAPGYLLYYRDKTLFAQHFDPRKFELKGEPAPILTEVQYQARVGRVGFSATDSGLLVAQNSDAVSFSQLIWLDRKGNQVGVVGKPDLYANVSLAPDGKSVAVDKTDSGNQNTDVWIYELQHNGAKRMTFDPAIDAMPVWSPDASRLAFSSSRQNVFNLYLKAADGAQEEKLIQHVDADEYPNDWSRDGRFILYTRGPDLWFLTLPEMKSAPFLKTPSTLKNGHYSPDGKWVAYASNESGKWEVYVTSFPAAQGKWQVSSGGGEQPRWRGDGKELFYLSSDGKVMAAPVTEGANFDVGAPVPLFQANPRETSATSELQFYDVSRDGQRFLINTEVREAEVKPMTVVLNWAARLNK
jgi:Tol biopolymer transport system component/predicted Ser/Thr protein kinase